MDALEIKLGAQVVVTDDNGTDLTPRGQKEVALLAILALSPEMRRPRLWLQDKLWSDRFAEQGAMSLRRALANIRKSFGPTRAALCADNRAVWLVQGVRIRQNTNIAAADFLAELSIADPEFEQWRLEMVLGLTGDIGEGTAQPSTSPTVINRASPEPTRLCLVLPKARKNPDLAFLERLLIDRIAERFLSRGPIVVNRGDAAFPGGNRAEGPPQLVLEIETDIRSNLWLAHFRLLTGKGRYFLWSGHLRCPMDPMSIWQSNELSNFLNTLVSTTIERSFARFRGEHFFRLQHAKSLLFTGQRRDLEEAESILSTFNIGVEEQPVVYAWRAFHRVTALLEFDDDKARLKPDAVGFAEEAARFGQSRSLVLALLAKVEMKFNDDPERADYLAGQALALRDDDPYALSAAAHAVTMLGRYEASQDLSQKALIMARGLPNEFIWDMQAALAALAVGKWQDAYSLAKRSHLRMSRYRPALRYLVAMSQLLDRPEEARRYSKRLQILEPDFRPSRLCDPNYPVHTLRTLGLHKLLTG